jgi:uncharacterized membrane protein
MKKVNQHEKQLKFTNLSILYHMIRCSFFSVGSLKWLFLNKFITKKILLFYFLLLLLPIKSLVTGEIYFLDPGIIIESVVLSFFYYFILFILIPVKKLPFWGTIRIFLSIEVINIFMTASLYLESYGLILLYSVIIGWYFTLSVFVIYQISQISYNKAIVIVSIAFLLTNFMPAIFNN